MTPRVTYRGEVLPNIATLSQAQIAGRIRHAAEIDRLVCRVLRRYRAKRGGDEAARAAVDAVQAWTDVGLASIYSAENRREVQVFTRARSV